VPEIERHVHTIKERTRCVHNTVPFKRMSARMTIEMANASVFWLNMFPASDGVSGDLSPRALIVGMKLDYDKHCRLEFGSCAQVHEEHDNSMQSRTTGAIALRPAGNAQKTSLPQSHLGPTLKSQLVDYSADAPRRYRQSPCFGSSRQRESGLNFCLTRQI
jgi:hypothetical protein